MKSILPLGIIFILVFSLVIQNGEAIQIKRNTKAKTKTKGFNIASIMQLVRKYESFSKTNFGAFINGFFLGLIDSITATKAQPTCTENKFWQVIQCFVGGADVALDSYYGDVGNFQNLPDNAQESINEAEREGDSVLNDNSVNQAVSATKPAESAGIMGWLQVSWENIKEKFNQAVDYLKTKIEGFWTKAVKFFDSPLIHGISKIGKCITPIAWDEIKEPALTAALTFLGVPFADKLKNILMKAPLIIQKLKDLFVRLKTTLTTSYTTSQQKYYHYGKATQDVIYQIKTMFDAARRMRRFRRIFYENKAKAVAGARLGKQQSLKVIKTKTN